MKTIKYKIMKYLKIHLLILRLIVILQVIWYILLYIIYNIIMFFWEIKLKKWGDCFGIFYIKAIDQIDLSLCLYNKCINMSEEEMKFYELPDKNPKETFNRLYNNYLDFFNG